MSTSIETNYDFKKNPVRNFVHDGQTSAPATPVEGQEYYNDTTKKKGYWNGSKWCYDVDIATDAQVSTGTAEDVAVNPKQLKGVKDACHPKMNYTPENVSNKKTSMSESSTDDEYPSLKLIYDTLLTFAKLASPAFSGTPTVPTPTAGDSSYQIANTAFVMTAISAAMTGALIYVGQWNTSNAVDFSGLNSYRPIKKGSMFRCSGSGCTINGVQYNADDTIIFNTDVSASTTIISSAIDHYDHTQSEDTVLLNASQTLTNKTISGASNTISNLALSMFATGVVLTAMSNSPSDTAILTEKAISTLLALKAPLASPAFTGTPTVPTPTASDDSTKIANTEWVNDAIGAAVSGSTNTEVYYQTSSLTPTNGKCTWEITHTLGKQFIQAKIFEVSTGNRVIMDEEATSSTQYTIRFNAASSVSANTYVAVLEG